MLETRWLPAIAIDQLGATFKNGGGRRQLYSDEALSALVRHVPDDAFCVLAVTLEDLVPHGDWNYVFGQASLHDRVGIFSFARFDPAFFGEPRDDSTKVIIARRRCGVLAHEIGHMFGIKHCIYYHCLMNGSNSLAEGDAAPLHLCPVCLRKLHQSVGFEILERERLLAIAFEEAGLTSEADWHRRRLQRSKPAGQGD
jgi:archaemetzincin